MLIPTLFACCTVLAGSPSSLRPQGDTQIPETSSAAAQERPDIAWERFKGRPRAYCHVVPPGLDLSQPQPVVVVLPPGDMSGRMALLALDLYWGSEATKRGWIVVAPHFEGLDKRYPDEATILDALLADIGVRFRIEGGRPFLAGVSNGGRAAFREAARRPEAWRGLLVAPGFPEGGEESGLAEIAQLPISMFVGGDDVEWLVPMAAARDRLVELGATVSFRSFPGEGHQPESLTGPVLFAELETVRATAPPAPVAPASAAGPDPPDAPVPSAETEVEGLLDGLHRAAAQANGERYFGCFTAEAVFIGTDPGERWDLEDYRGLLEPYLAQGAGWTYVPRDRHVTIAPGGQVAWFHERLETEVFGELRGTGVVVLGEGGWKIAQYDLSLPVPNEIVLEVVERIRGPREGGPARAGSGNGGAAGKAAGKNAPAKKAPGKNAPGKNAPGKDEPTKKPGGRTPSSDDGR